MQFAPPLQKLERTTLYAYVQRPAWLSRTLTNLSVEQELQNAEASLHRVKFIVLLRPVAA